MVSKPMQMAVDSKYSVSKGKEYWVKEIALAVSKSLSRMIYLIEEIIHIEQKSILSFAALALAGSMALAADPAVKKSDFGICHDAKSPSYERTKKFTEFKTVDECLKNGGKLPK